VPVRDPVAARLREGLLAFDERARTHFMRGLGPGEFETLLKSWHVWARDDQLAPAAAQGGAPCQTWLVLGGRGAGKTRAGAEWVREIALAPKAPRETARQIALVGETFADAREVMIEGVSGLLGVHRAAERPQWEPTRRRLVWPNGAIAYAFSADDPESLRGPQFDAAWCDALCKWRRVEAAFDMLQFGLRLGPSPRQMITTTPRPLPLLKRLLREPLVAVTKAATRANAYQLAPQFLEQIAARYAGTRLGRQELEGELIEARADTLFPRERIEAARVETHPPLSRIVVAIDPPASSREGADACGIVAAGIDEDDRVFVLADESAARLSPLQWASHAVSLYRRLSADRIVVEVNQGGEMVRSLIAEVDRSAPVTEVRATRGKVLRAEPVAALYEQGRVLHVGGFPLLEDEMADFGPDGLSGGRSPDRLDALVWAVHALVLSRGPSPRMRRL
jgi:phage terminase large subunit-like protein